jgi:hypothetical protein
VEAKEDVCFLLWAVSAGDDHRDVEQKVVDFIESFLNRFQDLLWDGQTLKE